MFGRVETFGKTNAADFAAKSQARVRFAKMTEIIQGLDAAKASQQGGSATAKEVMLDNGESTRCTEREDSVGQAREGTTKSDVFGAHESRTRGTMSPNGRCKRSQ